jgi:acyl-CoA thioester hydrolase
MDQPFRYYVRVRYQDCDSQHVVFNAHYGDYIDLAITEFLYQVLPDRDVARDEFEIQVRKQTIEWIAPARFQDVLEISTWVARFGRTSFDVQFDIRRAGTAEIIVTALATYVHVTGEGGIWRSTPIPEGPRALLAAGAKGKVIDQAGYFPIVLPRA